MSDDLNLRGRLRAVLRSHTPERGRFRVLSEMSGLSVETWKSMWYDRQRPSEEMFDFVFQSWPETAFWVATGITDQRHGHVAPIDVDPYPEPKLKVGDQARQLFLWSMDLRRKHMSGAELEMADVARLSQLRSLRELSDQVNDQTEQSDAQHDLAMLIDQFRQTDRPDDRPLLSKLLEELQRDREWTDEGMANVLGMEVADYQRAKEGDSKLLGLWGRFRVFDRWAYDKVRDALLKILPDEQAKKVRDLDLKRGLQ